MPYNFTLNNGNSSGYGMTPTAVIPYLVDSEGFIDMPGIGRIKVEGMRRTELVDYITKTLIERGLVKEPVVSVSFQNYRVTVLGVGNVLLSDEGFGVRVAETLDAAYDFPDDVQL